MHTQNIDALQEMEKTYTFRPTFLSVKRVVTPCTLLMYTVQTP